MAASHRFCEERNQIAQRTKLTINWDAQAVMQMKEDVMSLKFSLAKLLLPGQFTKMDPPVQPVFLQCQIVNTHPSDNPSLRGGQRELTYS